MPIDYYYKWCNDYTICTPDYKKISPNIAQHFNLYKKVMELYNMQSSNYYFYIESGRSFVKTNFIPYDS